MEVTGEEPTPRGRAMGALSPIRSAQLPRKECACANDCGRATEHGFPVDVLGVEDVWRKMARPFSASFVM